MKCDRSGQIVLHTQPSESSRRLPVDIAGQSMRVGNYQDQMMCARSSKLPGDFIRSGKRYIGPA